MILTLVHCIVCLEHREILRGRIPISSVDFPPNFVGVELGMRILNDSDVLRLSQFQSEGEKTKTNQDSKRNVNCIYCTTGSSSRPFQMPSTWRDIITCLRFSKAGSAVHPVFVTTVSGESFVIPKMLHASFKNVSAA